MDPLRECSLESSTINFGDIPDELFVNVIHFYVSNCSRFKNLLFVSKRFFRILTEWPYVWNNITRDVLLGACVKNHAPPTFFQSTPFTRTLYRQFFNRDSRIDLCNVEVCEDEDVPPAPAIDEMSCLVRKKYLPSQFSVRSQHYKALEIEFPWRLLHDHQDVLRFSVQRPRFYYLLLEFYNFESYSRINFPKASENIKKEVRYSLYLLHTSKTTFILQSYLAIILSLLVFVSLCVYFGHGIFGHYIVRSVAQFTERYFIGTRFKPSKWSSCVTYVFNPSIWGNKTGSSLTGRKWPARCGFFTDVMWPYLQHSAEFWCENPIYVKTTLWIGGWSGWLFMIFNFIRVIWNVVIRTLTLLSSVYVRILERFWPGYIAPTLHIAFVSCAHIYVFTNLLHIFITRLSPGRFLWREFAILRVRIEYRLYWEFLHFLACALAISMLFGFEFGISTTPLLIWLFVVYLCTYLFGNGLTLRGYYYWDRGRFMKLRHAWWKLMKKWNIMESVNKKIIVSWGLFFARIVHLGLMVKYLFGIKNTTFPNAMANSSNLWHIMVNYFTILIEKCPRISTFACIRLFGNYGLSSWGTLGGFILVAPILVYLAFAFYNLQRFYPSDEIYLTSMILFLLVTFPLFGFSRNSTFLADDIMASPL